MLFGWDLIPFETVRSIQRLFPDIDFQQFYGLTEVVEASILTLSKQSCFPWTAATVNLCRTRSGFHGGDGLRLVSSDGRWTQLHLHR